MRRYVFVGFVLVCFACVHPDAEPSPPAAAHPHRHSRPAPARLTKVPSPAGFKVVTLIPTTPIKDQESSGTCWSFATTSFIEAEALRHQKPPVSLSPIFYVAPTYLAKAERFIQRKGRSYFAAGDLTFSVLDAYRELGAVPEQVYDGIIPGDWQHDHLEMDNLLSAMVTSIGASGYGRIKPNSWKEGMQGVLRAYLGEPPRQFQYRGRTYTPRTFADDAVGIDPELYIEVTSFEHLPYYAMTVLKIPANWGRRRYLNVPLGDFARVIDRALGNGFGLAWDGDASEDGFKHETGFATDRRNKRVGHCGGRISPFSPRTRASLPRRPSPYREISTIRLLR